MSACNASVLLKTVEILLCSQGYAYNLLAQLQDGGPHCCSFKRVSYVLSKAPPVDELCDKGQSQPHVNGHFFDESGLEVEI
jgi:hypothetical protein